MLWICESTGEPTHVISVSIINPPELSGEIYFKGKKITIHSVDMSRDMGIETVYQERALSEQQTMWRNIFMGREITDRFGFLRIEDQKKETEKILREQMGFTSKAITTDSIVKSPSQSFPSSHR